MLNSFYKLSFIFTINLIASINIFAATIEEKNLSFTVNTESLFKGDIHFYAELASPRDVLSKYTELLDIDSLGLLQGPDVRIFLTKSAYIVNRPVGFFDENKFTDPDFISHVFGNQPVKKITTNTFRIQVDGKDGHSFVLKRFFDSDDMSTLPNSKFIRASIGMKRMDVISQSAASIMLSEKTKYSKYAKGGISISSFIPILENKTLIITYELHGIQRKFALPEVLKAFYKEEIEHTKKTIEK